MIGVTSAIVAYRRANGLRHAIEIRQKFEQRPLGEIGLLRHDAVEIVDIGCVVPVVMDFHRLGVDVRLECVGWKTEGLNLQWHGELLV